MSTTLEEEYNSAISDGRVQNFFDDLRNRDPYMKKFIDEVLATPVPTSVPTSDRVNWILNTDSYKATQYNMGFDVEYNEDDQKERLIEMFASIEPRKGARDSHVIVAGIQAVANTLSKIRITMDNVKDAIHFYASHFSTPFHSGKYHFNPFPWIKIVLVYCGCLPLKFCGIAEGTIVPVEIPLCTIESTDTDCAQIVSHVEGWVQKGIWYPTTCATNALGYSRVIKSALGQTTTNEILNGWLPFALQDFAYRGCTSEDAAKIGCSAILYVTMGSDTVPAVKHTMDTIGNGQMLGYSVAAIEHNQAMMMGREGEFKMVHRVLIAYSQGIVSYVADTYDLRNFVERVSTGELRDIITRRDGTFVIRPDSQMLNEDDNKMTPAETIAEIFAILYKNLSDIITVNEKGFKILPSTYKIIYGDGLNIPKITAILERMIADGWCATNIVFGVGGNLAQNINRDTFRFAMKASEQTFEIENDQGEIWTEVRDVCKETPGKQSKKGRFHIAENSDGIIQCFTLGDPKCIELPNLLVELSINGNICGPMSNIDEIRARVNRGRELLNI